MKKALALFLFFFIESATFAQFPANNKSVHFSNATDEGISIPANNLMDFTTTQSFTVEAWIRTNDAVNCMMIFAEQYCPGPSTGVLFYMSGGKVGLGLDAITATYTTIASNCSVADGNWHHVAGVRNVTTDSLYIYVDGVENGRVLDITTGTLTSSSATYWVGRRTWCGTVCNFYGDIDEVRVWHKAKTQSEIIAEKDKQLIGNETSLKLYYDFNTAANGNGQQVINNCSNTGSALNGTTVGTASEPSFSNAQLQGFFVPCDPVLWLKADAGAYTDAGVTLATNGQPVQQWNDQSGNGNHVTQTTAVNKPVFKSPDATGKQALYFDGTNGKIFLNNTTSNLVTGGTARTVFVVARRDCNAHAGGVLGGTLFTFRRAGIINTLTYGSNSYGTPVYIYSDNNGVGNNNASITGTAIDSAFSPTIVTYKIPAAGGQVQCNLNSVAQTVNQGSGSVTTETGTTGFTVGDREDQVDLDWSGWIYEVIVYNRSLSAAEIAQVESYLKNKYNSGSSANFTALPSIQTSSNSLLDDGLWKHSYNSADNTEIIASVKDYCFALGTRNDVVYVEPTAGVYNGQRYMRRHYVIKPTLNPAGPKRVRLYYTNADFADLQSYIPSLTSASQLVVTKYTGANENGVYDPTGGTTLLIPSSQITTGSLYGSNYLDFSVTGFSEFWIHTGNYVLPLNFTSFTAEKCNSNTVCLNWKTGNEQSVSHFEIERSLDGRIFQHVATTLAQNLASNNYSTVDDISSLQNTKQIYYRIKRVDRDNTFSYTNTQTVRISTEGTFTIYPNPTKDVVNISGRNLILQARLCDIDGRVLAAWNTMPAAIDVSGFRNGLYVLKLELRSGNTIEQKLLIRH